jgi:hypothetical protein
MTTYLSISKATSPLSLRERARVRVRTKRQIEVTMFAAGVGTLEGLVQNLVDG